MTDSTSLPPTEGRAPPTFNFLDLECAIVDAKGDCYLLDLAIEDVLRQDATGMLVFKPTGSQKAFLLTEEQINGLTHAANRVTASVAEASRVFYLPEAKAEARS